MVQIRGTWVKDSSGDWKLLTRDHIYYCVEDYLDIKKGEKITVNCYSNIYCLCTYNNRQLWIPTYCLSKNEVLQLILKHNLSRSLKYHLLNLHINNAVSAEEDIYCILLHDFIEINSLDVDCQRLLRTLSNKALLELFEWGYKLKARNASALVTKRIEKIKINFESTPKEL